MANASMNGRSGGRGVWKAAMVAVAAGAVLAATPWAGAEQTGDRDQQRDQQAERARVKRQGRAVKPSVIDLGTQAQERREGQVMPGDPSPRGTPRYVQAQARDALSAPAAAGSPVIDLNDSTPLVAKSTPVNEPARPAMTAAPAAVTPMTAKPVAPSQSGALMSEMRLMDTPRPQTVQSVPSVVKDERAMSVAGASESASIAVPGDEQLLNDRNGSPRAVAASAVQTTFARIDGNGSNIRYRMLDDITGLRGAAWATPNAGERLNGRVEIETAEGAGAVVLMGDEVKLVLSPKSRVRLEKQLTVKGGTELAVELTRGAVDIQPLKTDELGLSRSAVRVRTPDKTYTTRVGLRVEFKAEGGTTQQVVVPTE